MKKQLISEINRFRELMSLSSQDLIVESSVSEFLSKIGRESIEKEIKSFMEIEAKKIAQEVIAKGESTSYRAGAQGAGKISSESVDAIMKQIESKSGKRLTQAQKMSIEMDVRESLSTEVRNTINKETQSLVKNEPKLLKKLSKKNTALLRQAEDFAKKNPSIKGSTPKSTWQNLKAHFGKNWKKYLAAGLILAIFANYWPDEEVTPEPAPEPNPTPSPSPCPVGDVDAVKKFHDWLDNNVPNWHDKYGKLEGSVQKGYGVCGPRTKKWWALKKDEYLKGKTETNPENTTSTTTTINQTTSGGDYLTDF